MFLFFLGMRGVSVHKRNFLPSVDNTIFFSVPIEMRFKDLDQSGGLILSKTA
jgi:hypothetical protein